ncbi:MAG: hypothetical protein QNJ57_02740 [Flavobacteriaceae bacterium]|nr:hypothetical protein [Flavobacteriaceae bacterium]
MKKLLVLLIICFVNTGYGQQEPDKSYNPAIENPMYKKGKGPVVFIDEGHHNFHTKDGNYWAFAHLLQRDGYNVKGYKAKFALAKLSKGKILVVSNALNEVNIEKWYLPTPSAFSNHEIEIVRQWVKDGGSLFLIADHMPMAGAAQDLAKAFDFEFTNGFVFKKETNKGTAQFTKENGLLSENIITKGATPAETINKVVSFTGQGFKIPEEATSILTFDSNYYNVLPDTAWVFKGIPKKSVKGWSQGAIMNYGKGKVVLWGEAAMFTAQLAGPDKARFGMSKDGAQENYQLLLNIIHWLDGKLD